MALYVIVGILAYCLGSISFSVIFTKKLAGFDVRTKGSKNAGSTNVLRTAGTKIAALTLVCDILKGVVAVLIAVLLGNLFYVADRALLVQIAGILVILGHTFPIFFQFKGGKGVATAIGVLLVINWQIAIICIVFAIVLILLTKTVSIGSIASSILFPVLTLFITNHYIVLGNYIFFAILVALIIVYNHRSNIQRILKGEENKLKPKK